MNFSIIQKSQLEGVQRIDAEYFQPDYLELERKMALLNLPQLKDLDIKIDASAFYPSIAEHYGKDGIPFIRVADVLNIQINEEGLLFLPENIVKQHKTLRIGLPGDIIITKGGTVGNIALLPDKYPQYALSRDIIFIRTSEISKELALTISLFLASKFGRYQLIRGASQQVQPHLTLPLIRELHIPNLTVKAAIDLYNEALKEEVKSELFYQQAEDLLLAKLKIKDFKTKDELGYVVNLSDVKNARRFDAEHFQPKYKALIELLSNNPEVKPLSKLVIYIQRGVQPNYDALGKITVINSKNVGERFIKDQSLETTNEYFFTKNSKAQIRHFDILMNSTGVGTIGRTNCYLKKDNAVADNHITIIRPVEDCNPVYLSFYLNSIIGRLQTEQWYSGSSGQIEIYPESIKKFLVFVPPKRIQQQTAELVIKSYEAQKKSKEFLKEAKRKVEEMIERSGEVN